MALTSLAFRISRYVRGRLAADCDGAGSAIAGSADAAVSPADASCGRCRFGVCEQGIIGTGEARRISSSTGTSEARRIASSTGTGEARRIASSTGTGEARRLSSSSSRCSSSIAFSRPISENKKKHEENVYLKINKRTQVNLRLSGDCGGGVGSRTAPGVGGGDGERDGVGESGFGGGDDVDASASILAGTA